jgi:hypothetical protein
METWEVDHMKCMSFIAQKLSSQVYFIAIIGTRAFTMSQSAEAHLILFTQIFEIAHADTSIPCRFRHIHGEGFEIWIMDVVRSLSVLCTVHHLMAPTNHLHE